jgi:ribosomal protein S27AE
MSGPNRRVIHLHVPEALWRQARDTAAAAGETIPAMLRRLLRSEVSDRYTCGTCGAHGHNAATCPGTAPVALEGRRCSRCGQPGHYGLTCTVGQ